jgi:hypothetical protein
MPRPPSSRQDNSKKRAAAAWGPLRPASVRDSVPLEAHGKDNSKKRLPPPPARPRLQSAQSKTLRQAPDSASSGMAPALSASARSATVTA